jgi:Integrase core domain
MRIADIHAHTKATILEEIRTVTNRFDAGQHGSTQFEHLGVDSFDMVTIRCALEEKLGPGGIRENGYCEIFNGKLRDACLNGEIFYSLKEAQIVIEQWRVEYNTRRPHSALGYRPSAACSPRVLPNWISKLMVVI